MMHAMSIDWSKRKVLITGGTGFIGSFLAERLLDMGARVRIPMRAETYRSLSSRRAEIEWMRGDLRDGEFCEQLTAGVDEVFHLASCRRTPGYHRRKPSEVLAENLRMSLALVEGLKEHPAIPVTFFSSGNVPAQVDALELAMSQEDPDGYVLSKALCETVWITAAKQRQFPLLLVRPVGVYGPRDTFHEEANIIPTLMVKARDAKEYLDAWGTGQQERSFLYVEDLIEAVLLMRKRGIEGVQYVMSDEVVSVKDLAERICAIVRPGLPIHFDTSKEVGERVIPRLKRHSALNKLEWTSLDEGLRCTYESWANIPVSADA